MPWFDFIWTDENEEHILEHGITKDEVEYVVQHPDEKRKSRSSGRTLVAGATPAGREIRVVYEIVDKLTVYPITAYER